MTSLEQDLKRQILGRYVQNILKNFKYFYKINVSNKPKLKQHLHYWKTFYN